jgi:heme/copper-type cytochrome/quinol oxidase subunit 2
MWLLALFILWIVITAGVLIVRRLRASARRGSLSPMERERVLKKIMEWAGSELPETRMQQSR